MNDTTLELVRGKSPIYDSIRAKHYVVDNGSIGRQLRYLVHHRGEIAGIIAGGMSSLAGKARDEFFGLDIAQRFDDYFADEHEGRLVPMRTLIRNACIINNTVFRLTYREHGLASRVLALWRRQIAEDWNERYQDGIPILGFETYIVPHDHGNGLRRDGGCYRFDGWTHVGETMTGKMIYCRKNEDWESLYSGDECLLSCDVAALFQQMYDTSA
jgi:hypothetical protein